MSHIDYLRKKLEEFYNCETIALYCSIPRHNVFHKYIPLFIPITVYRNDWYTIHADLFEFETAEELENQLHFDILSYEMLHTYIFNVGFISNILLDFYKNYKFKKNYSHEDLISHTPDGRYKSYLMTPTMGTPGGGSCTGGSGTGCTISRTLSIWSLHTYSTIDILTPLNSLESSLYGSPIYISTPPSGVVENDRN
jgi:hypothetical protein